MIKIINNKLHTPTWLFLVMLAILVLRVPTLFEPYSYGDEMIYLTLGNAIRQGVPLYSGVHDNKPPLLYITAAIAGNLFWFKAILAIWQIVYIYIFWKLSEALFPKKQTLQKISTIIFSVLTTIPFFEGTTANAENFMIGFTILAFYILLTKKLTSKNLLISGCLFSFAALFKIPAAFDIPAIIFLWIATSKHKKNSFVKIAKNTLILTIGFAIPIFITIAWYMAQGALKEYIIAAYLQNFGYLSSFRPDDTRLPFLQRNAPLFVRAGVVALGMFILYIKRKKLSKQYIFLTVWLLLSLFAVALSERPYPHYLLQSAPAIALLSGMLLTIQNFEQSLTIIPLSLAFLVPVYFNFWHYPTGSYYVKFLRFATGQTTKTEYFDTFGGQTNRNYKVAEFIASSTNKDGRVFVWGDSSVIYALSKRLPPIKYVADYHIKDFSSTEVVVSQLKQNPPTLIVTLPSSQVPPELSSFITSNYALTETIDGAEIWKLLSSGVRTLIFN
jgi:4-amino-4-deoxy-L-arabinose transferase-like glycosyltransferase